MIELKNVSMKFNLGIEKNFSFKQGFVNLFSGKKKSKEYFWALKDVSFNVKKGEVVGLIGSNGAGKSTLLKVVSGVMKPTEGTVTVKGKISPMIELGAGFDGELTARENIYLNGAILGYPKEFIDEKFEEIVEFSELRDFLNVPVKNFSSGMTAKLAFSIATIVNPEVLIVDEILSVGDIKFQEKSKKKMMSLIEGGTTVLYVSHSIESIKELCTKVVWIEHGKVVEIGDPREVCSKYYAHMLEGEGNLPKEIYVNEVVCDKNTISYDYDVSKNLLPLFDLEKKLRIKYSCDISNVPYEIAVIPFIMGIMPMILLENVSLYVDRIDKEFLNSLNGIKDAYAKMLPNGKWKGKIIAKKVIDHSDNSDSKKSSLFYSGGVNSNYTLINHSNEKPDLSLIWGSDILQVNEKSWNTAKNLVEEAAKNYKCNANFIDSNFRFYIKENILTTKYRDLLPISWWHDVQYGMALIGHIAPLAYINKYSKHYISGNYLYGDNVVCGSNKLLDESVKFCGCKIVHYGSDINRIDKVNKIGDYSKKNNIITHLRSCTMERGLELNCSKCEKCYRTIAEIVVNKYKPNDFGFNVDSGNLIEIKKYLESNDIQGDVFDYWVDIQKAVKKDKGYFKDSGLSWLIDYDLNKINKKDFSKEVWNPDGERIK